MFNGYARELSQNGNCQVGYWKEQQLSKVKSISIPNGKWAAYLPDGSFRVKQDFYSAKRDLKEKSRMQILKMTPAGMEIFLKDRVDIDVFDDYMENIHTENS